MLDYYEKMLNGTGNNELSWKYLNTAVKTLFTDRAKQYTFI